MATLTLSVPELGCDGCEELVENAVAERDGVDDVTADQDAGTVVVEGEGFVEDAVVRGVEFAGYDASVVDEPAADG